MSRLNYISRGHFTDGRSYVNTAEEHSLFQCIDMELQEVAIKFPPNVVSVKTSQIHIS